MVRKEKKMTRVYKMGFIVEEVPAGYDKDKVASELPVGCNGGEELPLDYVDNDLIFARFDPAIFRESDRIDVKISAEKVRKYFLALADNVALQAVHMRYEIKKKTGKCTAFLDACGSINSPFSIRIQDHGVQTDITTWLYNRLVDADKRGEEFISFSIIQAFSFYYVV